MKTITWSSTWQPERALKAKSLCRHIKNYVAVDTVRAIVPFLSTRKDIKRYRSEMELYSWQTHESKKEQIRSHCILLFTNHSSLCLNVYCTLEISQDDFQELEKYVPGLFWQRSPHFRWSREKITLILVNGNYARGLRGDWSSVQIYTKLLFSPASSFSHNELTETLTKYEECLL